MNVPGGAHDSFQLITTLRNHVDLLLRPRQSTFDPWHNPSLPLHMTLVHDLVLIMYEILGFRISGVFTPLDFQCSDARNRETTHLDQRSDLP
jgi:hypothetical protein